MDVDPRSARDRILDTAAELFYAHGFHAIGVDRVIEQAAVAKTTLYRHFPSKDDLIVAWLERTNDQFWSWLNEAVSTGDTPAVQLLHLYDAVEQLATSPTCLGCAFQVTAAEFPEPTHPAHGVALDHKEAVRARLRDLAADAGAVDAAVLGDALLLLMDGAFAAARMYGPSSPAAHLSAAARTLIETATSTT
jgi:AcrR family transcriptional regulator